jgi:nucleoside-diphosphate-sugar epimerase
MTRSSHVVLGGNGIAGQETVRALLRRGVAVASVGRKPGTVSGAHSETADLMNAADADRVLSGREVAYFTVGLPYSTRVWAQAWPALVRNVIDAAVRHGTHLVYLDNVYAYGEVAGPMSEQTPLHPTSKKGAIRAEAVRALEAAYTERGLKFTIGRSADFYGPGAATSMVNGFVLAPAARGKACTWLFNPDLPHSLTYTPDVGEALAVLGTDPRVRAESGKSWHLPTAPALTGREYIALAAGPGARPKVMSMGMMRFGGLFNSAARETLELGYQFTRPYLFDSSRFETMFGIQPTSTGEGFAATLAAYRRST